MSITIPYAMDEIPSDDEELQLAFKKGLLKPGLNIAYEAKPAKKFNNVPKMLEIFEKIKLKLPFVERLDLECKPAALAPELAEKFKKEEDFVKNTKVPDQATENMDDFSKELYFHRLAQSAVLEGIPKLHELGIATKRPHDYYAEMAKSDEHMQKVRQYMKSKEDLIVKKELARKIRLGKKFGKSVEIQVKQRKQQEKKEMLQNVKKFRKGEINDLEFLDDKPIKTPRNKTSEPKNKKLGLKRASKDKKYGFGGPKRGKKRNTKEDLMSMSKKNRFSRNNVAKNKKPRNKN